MRIIRMRDARNRPVELPDDMRVINGLVAEDKVRTLTLFRPGNYAEHPTAPVDIAPRHDLLQGLGTHVKSILQPKGKLLANGFMAGTIELASTLEIMRLSGHQRYILLLYDIDGEITINGKTHEIRRYHTAIEAIFSPSTLDAVRGGYRLDHLAWMQRRLDACRPTQATLEKDQAWFRRHMRKFSHLFGMATQSVKLSINKRTGKIDNKRVQSSMPIERVQRKLASEGPYRGRFEQPNFQTWTDEDTFYGLKLPWFTISTDSIFSTIGDPETELTEKAVREMRRREAKRDSKRVIAPPPVPDAPSDDERYASEEPESRAQRAFDGGMVTIVRQRDGMRTISIDATVEASKRANGVCRDLGGRLLPVCGRWLGDLAYAKAVVDALQAAVPGPLPAPEPDHIDPLPPPPEIDPLRRSPTNPKLFYFDVDGSEAAALLMPKGNWVLMDQKNRRVADIFTAACQPYAPLTPWDGDHQGTWTVRFNEDRGSWLVRDQPEDLIRRVVGLIQRWKY